MKNPNKTYYESIGYDTDKSFVENLRKVTGVEYPCYITGRAAAQIWLRQKVTCMVVMAVTPGIYETLRTKMDLEEVVSERDGTYLPFTIPTRCWGSKIVRIYKPNDVTGLLPPKAEVFGVTHYLPVSDTAELISYFEFKGGLGKAWTDDLRYFNETGRLAPRRRRTARWN